MMATPRFDSDTLFRYAAGELDASTRAFIRGHVERSSELRDRVAYWQRIIETMRADDSEAPRAELLARAKALYQPPPASDWRSRFAELPKALARLVFDSRTAGPITGLRGASDTLESTFAASDAEVDLELIPPDAGATEWTLLGQVAPQGAASAVRRSEVEVVLVRDGFRVAGGRCDESGMFRMRTQPGVHTLYVRLDERVVELPPITVPQA